MERTIRFGLLLNTAEKRALARLAEIEGGLSQGAMLRNLIRKKAHERGLWPSSPDTHTQEQSAQEVHHAV
jgi:hypothetical protein